MFTYMCVYYKKYKTDYHIAIFRNLGRNLSVLRINLYCVIIMEPCITIYTMTVEYYSGNCMHCLTVQFPYHLYQSFPNYYIIHIKPYMSEEARQPSPLRHYFYIPRQRSHINLYVEYDFNYMKGARMSYLLCIHVVVCSMH